MHLSLSIRIAFVGLAMLVTACQTTGLPGLTLTTAQRAAIAEGRVALEVCELFPNITFDSRADSQLTREQIQAFNRARDAYCKGV